MEVRRTTGVGDGVFTADYAFVAGIDGAHFVEHAEAARANCPVSRALAAVPGIELTARQVA